PSQVRVELRVGMARQLKADEELLETKHSKDITLAPGLEVTLNLPNFRFDQGGIYAFQVRLVKTKATKQDYEPDDLHADNSRTLIVTVRDTVPVLLIDGDENAVGAQKPSWYLRLALTPAPDTKTSRFSPTEVTLSHFRERMKDDELLGYDCIFLCDAGQLLPEAVERVARH